MTLHRDARVGFGRAAASYERSRPGYPDPMLTWLIRTLDLRPGRTVVDVAAGTGKLTRTLAGTDATVLAIEPVSAMLTAMPPHHVGTVHRVAAMAQALPLADRSVDAMTVAQAFHWFAHDDALAEMVRVLRPGGAIALLWNRRPLDDPLQAAIEAIIGSYRADTPSYAAGRWRAVVERSPLVTIVAEHEVDHATPVAIDRLVDRVLSTSYVAALPDDERESVAERVRALQRTFTTRPWLRYACEAYVLAPL